MDTTSKTIELNDILNNPEFRIEHASLPGSPGLKQKKAFEDFRKKGLPGGRTEEYKYTNFSKVLQKNFQLGGSTGVNKEEITKITTSSIDAYIMVFINGKFSSEHSHSEELSEYFTIKNLADAETELLEKHFATPGSDPDDGFMLINNALAENGAFIHIKRNKVVPKPIHLLFITDAKSGNVFIQPHNIIICEENAQADIISSFHTLGSESSFNNIVSEIYLYENSNLTSYTIQNDTDNAHQVNHNIVHQIGKSNFSTATFTINGAVVRNNLNIILKSEYSEAKLNGLFLINGQSHTDNYTLVDHSVPNCYSNELYKGILNDKATGVFNGKIYVRADAQKTNAFQSNKNILLSPDATMNAKPQLEIFADDVKCSHGATIGQLDEEPLFYLRSRGIKESTAKKLLVLAFAQDVVESIKNESLKEILTDLITKRIN
ncbi:MAG: Fe-S cluster assembly protein SufD [Cytophagaceae bacterium]